MDSGQVLPLGHLQGYLQGKWTNFLRLTDTFEDDKILWHYGPTIVTLLYWVVGGIYLYMDVTGRPKFMRKFKSQPGTNEPVDGPKLKKALKLVVFNQIVVSLIVLNCFLAALNIRGHQDTKVLPTLPRIIMELIVCAFCYEFFFYYSHRLLHWGKLYRWIHKKHHEWSAPVALTAIHCHPIEHAFGNLTPVLSGLLISGSHFVTAMIWLTIVTLLTLADHSGYHCNFLISSDAHDFHHFK